MTNHTMSSTAFSTMNRYNWNIAEIGVKHEKTKSTHQQQFQLWTNNM